ncbi:MAG: YqhV family protein [Bacillaceae bacterium]|nr:YqhV family protein [Bacillaceae bacterium]
MKDWLSTIETAVLGMVVLRVISGLIEITAASIMLKFNAVEKALMVNAALAVVGPIILISTMTIGLVGMADKLSFTKLLLIGSGVLLIMVGLRK